MTVQLIAKSKVVYGGVPRNPGEHFEASEQDAFILSGLGVVERDDAQAVAPIAPLDPASDSQTDPEPIVTRSSRSLRRRDMKADDDSPTRGPKPKRSYRRRDLVAEGDE